MNTASVVSPAVPGPTTDFATTTITQSAALTVVKTVDLPAISAPGTLTYTITVDNTGNVDLTSVVLSDDLAGVAMLVPATDPANAGVLDTTETWVYTATYVATQADINAGLDLVNTASVVSTQVPGPTTDFATTTITQTPALTVVKTVDLPAISAPGTLTYTITVDNTGNVDLTSVVLSDDLAGVATLVPATDPANAGVLDTTETWVYTATYVATQADINAGLDLVNTASVVSPAVPGPTTDFATTTITQTPALTVVKTVDLPAINAPGTLTYTITVDNTGNVDLTSVVLSDDLAGVAMLVPATDPANAGVLDVTETWVYTATYVATQADINAGLDLVNTASVVSPAVPGPTTDFATTTITQTPALTVVKTVDLPAISAPGTLTYTITVDNTGNVDLTSVVLSDDLAGVAMLVPATDPANAGVLDTTETWVYTATYVATQADINAGLDLVNTASVVSTQVPGPTTDFATTTITQTPALTVVKTVDLPAINAPGTLTYTITVDNTGNVDLTSVVLSDDLAGVAMLVPATDPANAGVLDTTETWVYTATYVATQADINAGLDLVNTASVVSPAVPGPTEASATTTITQTASLTVVKTVDLPAISAPGTLTYTITVDNTGNVDLTSVVLSDDLAGAATLDPLTDLDSDGVLDLNETWVYTATYDATLADLIAGLDLVNTASVVSTQVPGPTTDDATTTIIFTPALTVVKTVDLLVINAPGTLTYTITVANTSNVDITNVVLSDDLAGVATLDPLTDLDSDDVLDVSETWVYTATYVATQADINAGLALVNTASVVTDQVPGPTTDDATTVIAGSIDIVKSSNATGTNVVGDEITYTFTVTNTGNVDLTSVVLSDTVTGGATLASGDLNTNGVLETTETWVYTAIHTLTQEDYDNAPAPPDMLGTEGYVLFAQARDGTARELSPNGSNDAQASVSGSDNSMWGRARSNADWSASGSNNQFHFEGNGSTKPVQPSTVNDGKVTFRFEDDDGGNDFETPLSDPAYPALTGGTWLPVQSDFPVGPVTVVPTTGPDPAELQFWPGNLSDALTEASGWLEMNTAFLEPFCDFGSLTGPLGTSDIDLDGGSADGTYCVNDGAKITLSANGVGPLRVHAPGQ